jgi:hypothetical protein
MNPEKAPKVMQPLKAPNAGLCQVRILDCAKTCAVETKRQMRSSKLSDDGWGDRCRLPLPLGKLPQALYCFRFDQTVAA